MTSAPHAADRRPRVAGTSPRVGLAVAAQHALAPLTVVSLTAGDDHRWLTADRDHRIDGVTAVAQPDGRFELGIHVVVSWPPEPLARLADGVRELVRDQVADADLERDLGEIHVYIDGIDGPGDTPGRS